MHETVDKAHGRLEIRRLCASTALNDYLNFPHVQQVMRIERITEMIPSGKIRHEIIYGITSLTPEKASPQRLLQLNREHWSIENSLHHVRDTTYYEDHSQIRTHTAPQIMATLRNMVLADLLRVDLLPECHMLPSDIRELRRILRYRDLIVRTAVKMQNKMSGLLMEVGAIYSKKRLHRKKYFYELLERVEDVPSSVIEILKLSRSSYEMFEAVQKRLVNALRNNSLIRDRVQRLMTIDGIGEITALTWVLEMGPSERFGSLRNAISYCGLCSAHRESAGKEQRGPISKKRNKHMQTVLIEVAKLAPHWNEQLAALHDRELKRGDRNRTTLAVARKLVAYMLAVEKQGTDFVLPSRLQAA